MATQHEGTATARSIPERFGGGRAVEVVDARIKQIDVIAEAEQHLEELLAAEKRKADVERSAPAAS